jgi:secondary thiamine-phosphate synthase enzyme
MNMITQTIPVTTTKRCQMIDITAQIAKAIADSSITEGQCVVFCEHTTAAVTINENADPDVAHDILLTLDELFPQNRKGYRHIEGNSDAHVKSSLVGCSEMILIKNKKLLLGTWQGIYFCEFDGPRNRSLTLRLSGL